MRLGAGTRVVLLALTLCACASAPREAPERDWLLVPGERAGPVTQHTSREALAALFGEAALKDVSVGLGEGFEAPGTRILEGTPHAFTVVWEDASRRRAVEVREVGTEWRTAEGLRLGLSFAELEQTLGPFQMAGFEWDYPGTVSLEGTRLARHQGLLYLRLEPREEAARETQDYRAVLGSKMFESSNPHLRALGLEVRELIVRLAPAVPPSPPSP